MAARSHWSEIGLAAAFSVTRYLESSLVPRQNSKRMRDKMYIVAEAQFQALAEFMPRRGTSNAGKLIGGDSGDPFSKRAFGLCRRVTRQSQTFSNARTPADSGLGLKLPELLS